MLEEIGTLAQNEDFMLILFQKTRSKIFHASVWQDLSFLKNTMHDILYTICITFTRSVIIDTQTC